MSHFNCFLCFIVSSEFCGCKASSVPPQLSSEHVGHLANKSAIDPLSPGMKVSEVKKLLGEPAIIWERGQGGIVFKYHIDGPHVLDQYGTYINGISVFFRDGKIETWKFGYTRP